MITETNFLSETFYSHSVIFFRQEKSFQDLFLAGVMAAVTAATGAPPGAGASGTQLSPGLTRTN
jgi:hypothetical protein